MHLVEYAAHYANRSFRDFPFNEVDALLFAQISYYNFRVFEDGISFGEIEKHPNVLKATALRNLIGNEDEKLFNIIIGSRRYRDVIVKWHVKETDYDKVQQFSATTFILPGKIAVIAFRGTDGTVVGWHEDMNMTYMFPIPGQSRAQMYINDVLSKLHHHDRVILTGHSKGGNLAIYAAVMADEKEQGKIKAAYNFDGPGFNDAFYGLDAYKNMSNKLHKFIPEQSSVGRMLMDEGGYKVIKSDSKYLMQHWAHNWQIEGHRFVYIDTPDFFSESIGYSTDSGLLNMTKDERKEAVTLMFDILNKTECVYMDDVVANKDNIMLLVKEYSALKDRRGNINKLVAELLKPLFRVYADKEYLAAKEIIKEKTDLLVDKVKQISQKFMK